MSENETNKTIMRNWKNLLLKEKNKLYEGAPPGEVSVPDFVSAVILSIHEAFQDLRPSKEVTIEAYEQISEALDQIFLESYQDVQRLAGMLGAKGGFDDWELDQTIDAPSEDLQGAPGASNRALIKPFGRYKDYKKD